MTTGERIKKIRLQLGISQVDFASKINVSKQTLYKYENNLITNIPYDKVEAVACICKVSPSDLMGWDSCEDSTIIKKEERRMNEQVTSKVDECIISVCNKVQNNESAPGEYADTVEALAALVEARAKLGRLFNGFA